MKEINPHIRIEFSTRCKQSYLSNSQRPPGWGAWCGAAGASAGGARGPARTACAGARPPEPKRIVRIRGRILELCDLETKTYRRGSHSDEVLL